MAKKIFDTLMHPHQIHSATNSQELRYLFKKDNNNHIEFWNYLSKQKWILYFLVDKDTRRFDFSPILPNKSSWDFCKKHECNSISVMWRINFQVLDLKERNFLKLLDDNLNPLKPDCGFNILAILTLFVLELPVLLSIILLLGSTS